MKKMTLSAERFLLLGLMALGLNFFIIFIVRNSVDANWAYKAFSITLMTYPLFVGVERLIAAIKSLRVKSANWRWALIGYGVSLFHFYVLLPNFYNLTSRTPAEDSGPGRDIIFFIWFLFSLGTFMGVFINLFDLLKTKKVTPEWERKAIFFCSGLTLPWFSTAGLIWGLRYYYHPSGNVESPDVDCVMITGLVVLSVILGIVLLRLARTPWWFCVLYMPMNLFWIWISLMEGFFNLFGQA